MPANLDEMLDESHLVDGPELFEETGYIPGARDEPLTTHDDPPALD